MSAPSSKASKIDPLAFVDFPVKPWEHHIVKHDRQDPSRAFLCQKCGKISGEVSQLRELPCVVQAPTEKECVSPDGPAKLGKMNSAEDSCSTRPIATPARCGEPGLHEGKPTSCSSTEEMKRELEMGRKHLCQLEILDQQLASQLQKEEADLQELELQMQALEELNKQEEALQHELQLLHLEKEEAELEKLTLEMSRLQPLTDEALNGLENDGLEVSQANPSSASFAFGNLAAKMSEIHSRTYLQGTIFPQSRYFVFADFQCRYRQHGDAAYA